ncbi:MAG: NADH:ubiquinone oxidoreductase subunit NDUFA12 [Rhodospirillaceae bacterium]|nr:NADH:ubiquinone oxidoreductase subunit NDUFA12 [Rhodospirillaceae bacterium]
MSIGTWLYTKFYGEKVGQDDYGNVYYRRPKSLRAGIREERWVIYQGEPEASKVPAEWHAWLHHTTDAPIEAPTRPWYKPHQPNLTGTAYAYAPPGADNKGGQRAKASGDYVAWTPES